MVFGNNLELSFEFFPPRNEREYISYENTVRDLSKYNPAFISFTDGAGLSKNREIIRSVEILKKYSDTNVVAHITSCDKEKEDIDKVLFLYSENSIDSFLIIRGDCPRDEFLMDLDEIENMETGFPHASDLISYLSTKGIKNLGFAAFPTGHPEDKDKNQTRDIFELKVKSGGTFSATQLFFDAQEYINFYNLIKQSNIQVPIYAGIMPLISFQQAKRFAQICDINLPKELVNGFQSCTSIEQERNFGISYITNLCNELIDFKVDGLHFYTLNRSKAFKEIVTNLNSDFKFKIGG